MNLDIQNTEKSLQLLAAQDRLYAGAKTWVYVVFLSTLAPIVAALLPKTWFTEAQIQWTLSLGGAGGLVLVLAIDSLVKRRVKMAAVLQEEFDTDVFEMNWNEGLAGKKITPEIRIEAAGSYKIADSRLPWYSAVIGAVPDKSVQVLLCQRENAAWDWQLKKYMTGVLFKLLVLECLALILWGLLTPELLFCNWLLFMLVPASGLLVETWKLWQGFKNVAGERESLNSEIEVELEVWKKTKTPIPDERLRLLQDKMLKSRLENTLVPDRIYQALQTGYQQRTVAATAEIVNGLK